MEHWERDSQMEALFSLFLFAPGRPAVHTFSKPDSNVMTRTKRLLPFHFNFRL